MDRKYRRYIVLEANPGLGMPAYQGPTRVVDQIDAIDDYLKGVGVESIHGLKGGLLIDTEYAYMRRPVEIHRPITSAALASTSGSVAAT